MRRWIDGERRRVEQQPGRPRSLEKSGGVTAFPAAGQSGGR